MNNLEFYLLKRCLIDKLENIILYEGMFTREFQPETSGDYSFLRALAFSLTKLEGLFKVNRFEIKEFDKKSKTYKNTLKYGDIDDLLKYTVGECTIKSIHLTANIEKIEQFLRKHIHGFSKGYVKPCNRSLLSFEKQREIYLRNLKKACLESFKMNNYCLEINNNFRNTNPFEMILTLEQEGYLAYKHYKGTINFENYEDFNKGSLFVLDVNKALIDTVRIYDPGFELHNGELSWNGIKKELSNKTYQYLNQLVNVKDNNGICKLTGDQFKFTRNKSTRGPKPKNTPISTTQAKHAYHKAITELEKRFGASNTLFLTCSNSLHVLNLNLAKKVQFK